MNLKSLYASVSRGNVAFATALAITATGMLAGPAQAVLPADGEYSCATGSVSNVAPTFSIVAGNVFDGRDCVGAVLIPDGATGIGAYAFDSSALTSISIPDTVIQIGAGAFWDANRLTSITIPSSVTSIGDHAFTAATSLTSISIPNSVTSIGDFAFEDANRLTSITLPNSITLIGEGTFLRANALTSITIPNSVTSIGNRAFEGAISLTSITIPSRVTSIGNHAFSQAFSLTSITIPNSVTSIGEGAFSYATSLTAIIIPNGVTTIRNNTFGQTPSLKTVTLPASLTSIEGYAFEGSAITSIVIPEGVTAIEEFTFANATSLTSITISSSVTSIGELAFNDANRLENIYFLGSAPEVYPGAFAGVAPFAKTFITSSAVGFQPNDPGLRGYGNSQVEIFWNGLIIRPAPAYLPSSLYSSWQTPLPGTVSGPNVGDTVYASAFERPLSRRLYNPDVPDLAYYREDLELFPTLEEYVYRITKEPNMATSSVDEQSTSGYRSLSEEQQLAWYESMGYIDSPYLFSWRAYMCADVVQNIDEFVPRTLSKPNGLTLSYSSREAGVTDGGFNREYSHLFRDMTYDLFTSSSPTTRTVVGIYDEPGDIGDLIGGPDGFDDPQRFFAIGVSEVNANCGAGKTLQALQIVDPASFDSATSTYDPVTTKSLVIPNFLKLKVRDGQYQEVGTSGLTIGVTGSSGPYSAALWGLTTIADPTPPPAANQPSNDAELITRVPAEAGALVTDRTKSIVFSGFAGDSSKMTYPLQKAIGKLSSGFKKIARVECKGFTSGTAQSRWDFQLAKNRAKAACDFVRQSFNGAKGAKVSLKLRPATGKGAKFRSVEVTITGS